MKNLFVASSIAVASLFAVTGCAVTDDQSTVGEFVDDAAISTKVKAKFADDKQVSAMRIQVETLKGEVQLSGFASSQAEKERAGQIARSVDNAISRGRVVPVRACSRRRNRISLGRGNFGAFPNPPRRSSKASDKSVTARLSVSTPGTAPTRPAV